MPEYIEPPASDKKLDFLLNRVYKKSLQGTCSTVVSFPGAGITSELKYLSRQVKELPEFRKFISTFLDLHMFGTSEDMALRESITYIISHYFEFFSEEMRSRFEKILIAKSIKIDVFLQLLHRLTFNEDFTVNVVADSFYLVYRSPAGSGKYVELLNAIKRVNPMKISLVFIASYEFDERDATVMGKLSPLFVENVINGKDIQFGSDSAKKLVKNQEKWCSYKFSTEFISKVIELSSWDPSVIKIIIVLALENQDFQKQLMEENNEDKLYELIGSDRLDQRYRRIVDALQKPSLDYLLGNNKKISAFLVNTGLVLGERVMNPLFSCYLSRNHAQIERLSTGEKVTPSPIYAVLSSQELSVFRLLESRPEVVVTKDDVAKAMWGEEWETKYSDWAIDQLMSRLRNKLNDLGYGKRIKSVKGKGLMLIQASSH